MKKVLFCLSALTLVLMGCNPEPNPNPNTKDYTSVAIYPSELNITNDDEVTLQFVYEPTTAAYPENLVWESSDWTIAEVDSLGVVYPVAEGICEITATVGDQVATCKVTVQDRSNAFRPGHLWIVSDGTLVSKDTVNVPMQSGESYKCLIYRFEYYFTGDKITADENGYFQGSDYLASTSIPMYVIAEEGDYKGRLVGTQYVVTDNPLYADSVGYIMAGSVNDIEGYAQLFFTANGDMNAYVASKDGAWFSMGDFTLGSLMYVSMASLKAGSTFLVSKGDLTSYDITLDWITHDFVTAIYGVAIEEVDGKLALVEPLQLLTYEKNYKSGTATQAVRTYEIMDSSMKLSAEQVKDLKQHAINKNYLSLMK